MQIRVTRVAGGSAESLLGWLGATLAPPADPQQPPRAEREAVVAALNGVLGDHLAASGNPLAIQMAFRHGGRELPLERAALRARLPAATARPLVLVHGLCMNDLQWQQAGHDHGQGAAHVHRGGCGVATDHQGDREQHLDASALDRSGQQIAHVSQHPTPQQATAGFLGKENQRRMGGNVVALADHGGKREEHHNSDAIVKQALAGDQGLDALRYLGALE